MILVGKYFQFILCVLLLAMIYISIQLTNRGVLKPKVRPFPAIQALPEVIGRCAEMNRPVHLSTGTGSLADGYWGTMVLVGLSWMGKAAEYAGEYGVPVKYFSGASDLLPSVQDLIRSGYEKGGRPEMYSDDMVQFVAGQRGIMAAVMGYMASEKPAANIGVGGLYWEAIIIYGTGATTPGCVQIGGTPNWYYQGNIVALVDYPLIGPECYAAAAAIRDNPWELGVLAALDYGTFIALIMVIISSIINSAGLAIWSQLIQW